MSEEYVFPKDGRNANHGISLRDYFAAKAMQGFAANPDMGATGARAVAKVAYAWADAMLKAREE